MTENEKKHKLALTAAEERERELRKSLMEMEGEKQRMGEDILRERTQVEEGRRKEAEMAQNRQNTENEVKILRLENSHLVKEVSVCYFQGTLLCLVASTSYWFSFRSKMHIIIVCSGRKDALTYIMYV